MNLFLGQNTETNNADGSTSKTLLFGINPFLKFETNWLGIGGGLHAGNLILPMSQNNYNGNFETGLSKKSVLPQLYVRFGPKRFIYVDYHLADQFVTPFPAYYQSVGLGSSLGFRNETNLHVAFINPFPDNSYSSLFGFNLSAYVPLNKVISVEPALFLSAESGAQFTFGLHYILTSKSYNQKIKK